MKKMNRYFFTFFAVVSMLLVSLVPEDAEARRMGGGRSLGRQSDNVMQRRAPERPVQQANNTSGGQRTPGRSGFGGILGGLAAGLGLAALFSYLGFGAELAGLMGNMLLIAAVVLGGLFLFRMFSKNRQNLAYPTAKTSQFPQSAAPSPAAFMPSSEKAAPTATSQVGDWSIPQGFDVPQFLQEAKKQFLDLQRAFDAADLRYIEAHVTADMFKELKADIDMRLGDNVTEFLLLTADLMGVEVVGADEHLASVRFSGMVREEVGGQSVRFEEVWNILKSPGTGWLLAGIQPL